MTEIVRPAETQLDHVLADWLLAHDRGLAPGEARRFEAWLAGDPAHAAAWSRVCGLWTSFDQSSDPVVDALLMSARKARPPVLSRGAYQIAAAAAVILVVLLGAGLMSWRHGGDRDGQVALGAGPWQSISTSTRPSHLTLADGSILLLDAQSHAEVRFGARREVVLTKGQAFFDVVHDAQRPFVVTVGRDRITDIGTAFSVSNDARGLSVILQTGRVTIARAGVSQEPIALQPGQQYVEQSGRGAVEPADVEAALAWRDGKLVLRDTPLAQVVERFNRYGGAPLVVGDVKAANLKINGQYRLDDAAGFADSLTEIYPVQLRRRSDGGLEITSR